MQRILLIITGSIAAYKCIDLARSLEGEGGKVSIILTEASKNFVTPLTFKSLTSAKVYDDAISWEAVDHPMLHIELSRKHDLVIIVPATADYIAKMAAGIADSLSLCTLLAYDGPIIVAPAMNPKMWEHKATQRNINILKDRGVRIADPISGLVACKDFGYGKYVGNDEILRLKKLMLRSRPRRLQGVKVGLTLGSTREMIDPVRFVGNASSGTQGALIADCLIREGAEVTIVSGLRSCILPDSIKVVNVTSAHEMFQQVVGLLPVDIFIGCAAVSDFAPIVSAKKKIKKQEGEGLTIELLPNPDIIATVARQSPKKRPPLVVAFALESDNHLDNAKLKFERKGVDLMVLNKSEYIGEGYNDYTIIASDSITPLGLLKKEVLAERLIDEIVARYSSLRTVTEV